VRRNAQFIKAEAVSLGDRIKQTTGIETKEDLKQMVAGAMKLFAECVNQLMAGYRRERDDKVEQMLTQYFQHPETAPPAHRPKNGARPKPGFVIAHGRSFGNVIYERRFSHEGISPYATERQRGTHPAVPSIQLLPRRGLPVLLIYGKH
jgi:hypothetical protein